MKLIRGVNGNLNGISDFMFETTNLYRLVFKIKKKIACLTYCQKHCFLLNVPDKNNNFFSAEKIN